MRAKRLIEPWRVEETDPKAWIQGLPKRRLYGKGPHITYTRVGIVMGSIFMGKIIVPKAVLSVLSKTQMKKEDATR